MNVRHGRRRITFDTNLAGIWNTRVFWGTLCEDIGQSMILTPTAGSELLRRVRLETEREWTRKLKHLSAETGNGWSKVQIRRLATIAAGAARDWIRDELGRQGSIYAQAARRDGALEQLEAEIDDAIDDRIFDLSTDNGVRDRKIAIEAMARGFDILASNNVTSIDHGMLRDWIENREGRHLGITTTILRPEPAEERLRKEHEKPIEWTVHAAARASVTDPDDERRSAREIDELVSVFDERGMSELQQRIYRLTRTGPALRKALESVRSHGPSRAMRSEREMDGATAQAVSRRAGMTLGG